MSYKNDCSNFATKLWQDKTIKREKYLRLNYQELKPHQKIHFKL